jgi:hypothetical protein
MGTWAMNLCCTTSSKPLPASVLPLMERNLREPPEGAATATTASAPSR